VERLGDECGHERAKSGEILLYFIKRWRRQVMAIFRLGGLGRHYETGDGQEDERFEEGEETDAFVRVN
jgi:hypothetical protein